MVELEAERAMSRSEVANFLREFADELEHRVTDDIDRDDPTEPETMTVIVGDESATFVVPQEMEFDVEIESRSPLLGSGQHQSIEFELEWDVEDVPESDTVEVT